MELPEKGLCHVRSLFKTLLNHTHVKCESEKLNRKEEKERQLKDIKFEKNLIFRTQLDNSRGIITIPREDSLQWQVGC